MNEDKKLPPKDWAVVDLMAYMYYEMGWPIDVIARLTKEQLIQYVEHDEIDRE